MLVRPDNLIVAAVLPSPMHRLLSGTAVLLRYRGRKSGQLYTIPVQYARTDGELLLFVMGTARKQWWRKLRARPEVDVLLRGVWRRATARIVRGDETLARRYAERFRSARWQIEREEPPVFVVLTFADTKP